MRMRKVVLPFLPILWLLQVAYSQTLTTIDITPSSITMRVGEQLTFTAAGKDASGNDMAIPQPQWLEDEAILQNTTTTSTFTAARTGHFTLSCRDAASGIEASVGISVIAPRGDTSEILETTGSPPPMTGATLVALKGDLYLFGGSTESGSGQLGKLAKPLGGGGVLSSTWRLDGVEGRWEEEETFNPPPARQNHAATTDGEQMYVFAGEDGDGSFLGDGWAYNPDNQTWTQITIDPPLEGVSGASAYILPDGTMIICGGYLLRDGEKVPNYKVHRVNPADGSSSRETFTPTSSPVWYPMGTNNSADGSELWMLDDNFDQVSTYNLNTGEWTYQDIPEPLPPPELDHVQTYQMYQKIVCRMFGGTKLESWEYDFVKKMWAQQTDNPDLIQSAGTLFTGGFLRKAFSGSLPKLYLFGGQRLDGSLSDETIVYTPPYEEALANITVTPNEAQISVNEIIRFVAIGHDAEDFPTSLEPVWSSTGGTIDQLGFFTTTDVGDYTVTASVDGSPVTGNATVHVDTVTSVDTGSKIPTVFKLYQNYPNPFNPSTSIKFGLPELENGEFTSLQVKLAVYDILGREVIVLLNEKKSPGYYEVIFNAGNLPSGIYFYKLSYSEFVSTKKLLLIK